MIISRTPYRVSFFGGGTDYPSWYREHGGAVLATTIDKYCYLTCRYLPPFFDHTIRIVYSQIESCHSINEIRHPAVREVLRFLDINRGVEIHHDGDLPARSGMGSSSSFTVGLLHALRALKGHIPTRHQLAVESMLIERERLQEAVGSQDQVLASYGGFNNVIFSNNGEFSVRPMTLSEDRVHELNSHVMLFYTGIVRTSSDIVSTYITSIKDSSAELNRMREMVDEGISVLLHDPIERFGKLLDEAWRLKRRLSPAVSNRTIEDIYKAAQSAGAIGGKLTGAGGGGFLLLFAPPSRHARIRKILRRLIFVPFRFESAGSQIIFFDREREYAAEEKARTKQPAMVFREIRAPKKALRAK